VVGTGVDPATFAFQATVFAQVRGRACDSCTERVSSVWANPADRSPYRTADPTVLNLVDAFLPSIVTAKMDPKNKKMTTKIAISVANRHPPTALFLGSGGTTT
jgi:hypothetical protein